MHQGDAWPLFGRDEELQALDEVIRGAQGAAPGVGAAVVVSPAGTGKTRLLRDALAKARERGHRVEWVLGTRATKDLLFAATAHLALSPDVAVDEDVDVATVYRTYTARLLGHDGLRPVIGVDDAHLLDDGSAGLLLHLVLADAATVIATVRSNEPAPDALTALWKDGLAQRMDLQRMSHAEVGALVAAVLGGEVAPVTQRDLASLSAGNPLLARELVLTAVEAETLRQVDGVWRWDGRIVLAPRLVDVVDARLKGLSAAAREFLGLVALGEPLPGALVDELGEVEAVVELERRGLVEPMRQGRRLTYRLGHPLYGEVVVEQFGEAGRRGLRRRLADALESQGLRRDDDGLRATVLRLDAGLAADPISLTRAAEQANHRRDHELAARLATAALGAGATPRAALALAVARNRRNRFAEAEELLAGMAEHVLSEGDPALVHRYVRERFTALHFGLGDSTTALEVLAAHGHDPRPEMAARIEGYRAQVLLDLGRTRAALDVGRGVIESDVLDDLGRLGPMATVLLALCHLGRAADARAQAARVDETVDRLPEGLRQRRMLWNEIQQATCVAFDGRAGDVIARLQSTGDELPPDAEGHARSLVVGLSARAHLERGTAVTARRLLRDAVAALRVADPSASLPPTLALLAMAEAMCGDVEASARTRGSLDGTAGQRRLSRHAFEVMAADVWLAVAGGELSRAVGLALAGADDCAAEQPLNEARLRHLALRLGAPPETAAQRLDALARSCDNPWLRLMSDHAIALADRDAMAMERVADRFEDRGLWLPAAEAAATAAGAYARAGLQAASRRAAANSQRLAACCEGVHTPGLAIDGTLAALSRREREVAGLAARGRSNAQIADALTVSVRTVESHLYQAFAKLGITTRDELPKVLGVRSADAPVGHVDTVQ